MVGISEPEKLDRQPKRWREKEYFRGVLVSASAETICNPHIST